MTMTSRELKRAVLAERMGYGATVAPAWPVGAEWEQRQSTRQASVGADVAVPLCQALVSGGFAGVVGGLVGDVSIGIGASVVVSSAVWAWLLSDHSRQLWSVERLVSGGHPDAHPVEPEPARSVRLELVEPHRIRWLNLPVSDIKLLSVSRAILEHGKPFSRRGLRSELSQGEYAELASVFVDAGLAVDVGNKRELTAAGRQLLRQMLE